jgi:membrane fusion protein (multidrug efflux system)
VIEKRLFREGSEVEANTSLFQIDARSFKAAAESAQADLAIARQIVKRYKSLLEVKAVSQQEYDLAAGKAKQAEAVSIKAEENLANASVPAAISGHIGRALVTEGALVGKSEATLLATIEQLDPIYANFTQSGADMLRLRQAVKAGKLKHADAATVQLLLEDGSLYPQTGKIFLPTWQSTQYRRGVAARRIPPPARSVARHVRACALSEAVAENDAVPARAPAARPVRTVVGG